MSTLSPVRIRRDLPRYAGFTILGTLIAVFTLFPFFWLVISSFKPEAELFSPPPRLIPDSVTLANYVNVIQRTRLPTYFMNTVIYTVTTLAVVLVVGSLAAYGISRFRFRGRTFFFLFIIASQVMPMTTLIIPLYVLIGRFDLTNTYIALIATYAAVISPVSTWLLTGYFNSIPRELDESAKIEGLSSVGILFRIIMPLARPGLAAAGMNAAMSVWQELMLAMTFTSKDSVRTLMAGVTSFITRSGVDWGPLNAAGVLSSLPVLVLFVFFQRNLMRGLTQGAVKG